MKVSSKSEAMVLRQKMVHYFVQVGSALLLLMKEFKYLRVLSMNEGKEIKVDKFSFLSRMTGILDIW